MAWSVQFPVLHLNAVLDHSKDKAFLEDSSWCGVVAYYFPGCRFHQLVDVSGVFSW